MKPKIDPETPSTAVRQAEDIVKPNKIFIPELSQLPDGLWEAKSEMSPVTGRGKSKEAALRSFDLACELSDMIVRAKGEDDG